MFDFCKLDVYQKAKAFCVLITKAISSGVIVRASSLVTFFIALTLKLTLFLNFPKTYQS